MAHRRDDRRTNYIKAVETYFRSAPVERAERSKKFKVRASTTGLDEVLYDPRRLVCAPDSGDTLVPTDPLVTAVRELVDARIRQSSEEAPTRSASPAADQEGPEDQCDPRILEPRESDDWRVPRSAAGLPPGQRLVFDLPLGVDSAEVAVELDQSFRGRSAPVYYTLLQQTAQPGEDPEAGYPVFGLPPLVGAAAPDDAPLGRGVTVAVIDTGIDEKAVKAASLLQHFSNQFDPGDRDLLGDPTNSAVLGPAAGHGTFIAGLIHCVAPGALVRSYLVSNSLGFSDEEVIALGISRAIQDFAAKKGGDGHDQGLVINLSLGGYPFEGQSDLPSLRKFAVLEAAIAGIPEDVAVVAAAGNSGSPAQFYPAAFDGVIGVAALDDCRHELWDHSNYGSWVKACASGVNLRGLFVDGKESAKYDPDKRPETWNGNPSFATWSGTSFAAPLVAAQLALLAAELKDPATPSIDTRRAGEKLLGMSKVHPGSRPCGKRILVDLPGQT